MRDDLRFAWRRLTSAPVLTITAVIDVRDPATLCAAALTVLATAALAAYLPARRAGRVDPLRRPPRRLMRGQTPYFCPASGGLFASAGRSM